MTCIIGYKDKDSDKVYMGCDSCITTNNVKSTASESFKIFKAEQNNNILVGIAGALVGVQAIKYRLEFPSEEELEDRVFDERYINKVIVPRFKKLMKEIDGTEKDDDRCASVLMLIAYKNKLFKVSDYFSAFEENSDYMVIGSGEDFARGALRAIEKYEYSIVNKIFNALNASTLMNNVEGPFYIHNTRDDTIKVRSQW